jgi:hypothetical protein
MGRILAALLLGMVMLLAPVVSAQVSSGAPAAAHLEIGTQASFDTGYLLSLYMAQLAAAGTPPTPADIDEAARLYLTNGAAVTGVPNSGPRATYFQNGAGVTGVPTNGPGAAYFQNGAGVLAYAAPVVSPTQEAPVRAGAGSGAEPKVSRPEDTGVAGVGSDQFAANGIPGSPPLQSPSGASTATYLTCPPREIEAAMAFASQFATVAAAPAPPTEPSYTPASASVSVAPAAETAPALVKASPALACPSGPSVGSRVLAAMIGAILGGLAVALWSRPRALRVAHRH